MTTNGECIGELLLKACRSKDERTVNRLFHLIWRPSDDLLSLSVTLLRRATSDNELIEAVAPYLTLLCNQYVAGNLIGKDKEMWDLISAGRV